MAGAVQRSRTSRRRLNRVRPRRPEQSLGEWIAAEEKNIVSIESGLEGRNNVPMIGTDIQGHSGLNRVRPRRPEQLCLVCPEQLV